MTATPATEKPLGDDLPQQLPGQTAGDAIYENYWGVDETYRFMLPDDKQYFEIRPMDEGRKVQFQKLTNKAVRMNQRTEEASFDIDPAEERWTLIKESVIGYHIMQPSPDGTWSEYPCPPYTDPRFRRSLEQLLEKFNPKIVQDLEFFIRQKNPWMQADMAVEDIDKEIDRLQQMRRDKVNQESGEGSSANR